jgi:hypothetical protein
VVLVEAFKNDNTSPASFHIHQADERDEVKMRQSEEVSMSQDQQQLLLAFGSAFTHSRLDSG